MKLKDYILEYVSSGRRNKGKRTASVDIEEGMEFSDFMEAIESIGYKEVRSIDELKDKRLAFNIRVITTKRLGIIIKNGNESSKDSVYMRAFFDGSKLSASGVIYLFIDGNGDTDYAPSDIDSLKEYIAKV
jgi:hypothetical protein